MNHQNIIVLIQSRFDVNQGIDIYSLETWGSLAPACKTHDWHNTNVGARLRRSKTNHIEHDGWTIYRIPFNKKAV